MMIVHVYITLPARLEPSGPETGLWTGFGQLPAALVEPLLAGVGPLGRRGRRLVLALQQVPDRVDLGPRDRPLRAYRAGDAAVEELPVWKPSFRRQRHRRDVDFHTGNRVLQHIHLVSAGRTCALRNRIAYKLVTATTTKKARRSRSATAPINPNRKKAFFVSVFGIDVVDASVGYSSVSSSPLCEGKPAPPPPPPPKSSVNSKSYSSSIGGMTAAPVSPAAAAPPRRRSRAASCRRAQLRGGARAHPVGCVSTARRITRVLGAPENIFEEMTGNSVLDVPQLNFSAVDRRLL